VELTDEVRGVFDRILSSEREIAIFQDLDLGAKQVPVDHDTVKNPENVQSVSGVNAETNPLIKEAPHGLDSSVDKVDSLDSQKLFKAGFSLSRQTPEYTSYKIEGVIGASVAMICTVIHFEKETPPWAVRYDIKENHKEGRNIANTKVVTGSFKTVEEAIEMYQSAKFTYGGLEAQTQNLLNTHADVNKLVETKVARSFDGRFGMPVGTSARSEQSAKTGSWSR
jgi:hypothetical protein